ncbi:hypothetical protein KIL84_021380 [Mauremys mutica]|uniref:Uncharacterized protein n=1 Tax=Mauremys mutica TaxID=74926 RepID=A0A9D3X822_9SAUR|nr:hypothetical protein KIL84_021380 [Mauremys mutica]
MTFAYSTDSNCITEGSKPAGKTKPVQVSGMRGGLKIMSLQRAMKGIVNRNTNSRELLNDHAEYRSVVPAPGSYGRGKENRRKSQKQSQLPLKSRGLFPLTCIGIGVGLMG